MKCVIAGSRDLGTYRDKENRRIQMSLIDCPWFEEAMGQFDWKDRITEIVSGAALGVDTLGEQYADKYGIEKSIFPAKWSEFGRRAGSLRNEDMAKYADVAVVMMVKGGSTGSKDMIDRMMRKNKPYMAFEVIGGVPCQVK